MIGRNKLETKLSNVIDYISMRKQLYTNIQNQLLYKHNMILSESNVYLLKMKELNEASVEELFWISQSIIDIIGSEPELKQKIKDIDLNSYFTKSEIISYSDSKNDIKKQSIYPLVFEGITEVNDDQWITVKDVNFLKGLYDNQIINYNKNTQRNLTPTKLNGSIVYNITLKEKSVKEIMNLLDKSLFISNSITLNLNLDNPEVEFEIDDDNLIVYAGQLDIIDGYHRFRALMQLKNAKPDFNYKFIINIMNFNEDKACTYISQEDKRNKINKGFSKSLDSTNPTSLIVKRLGDDSGSYLYGKIGKTPEFKINYSTLFNLIDYCYKPSNRTEAINITKHIKNIFNTLIDSNDNLIDNIDFKHLAIIVRLSLYVMENKVDICNMYDILDKSKNLNETKFNRVIVNKSLFREIDNELEAHKNV